MCFQVPKHGHQNGCWNSRKKVGLFIKWCWDSCLTIWKNKVRVLSENKTNHKWLQYLRSKGAWKYHKNPGMVTQACTSTTPENQESEASLGYTMSARSTWATQWDCLKISEKRKELFNRTEALTATECVRGKGLLATTLRTGSWHKKIQNFSPYKHQVKDSSIYTACIPIR